MEQCKIITNPVLQEHFRRHEQVWRVLVAQLSKCALHSRQGITESDYQLYYEAFQDADPQELAMAIQRCRESGDFIPKIHHIREMYREPVKQTIGRKVKFSWYEYYSETHRAHYFEYEDGGRAVRFEPLEEA